MKRLVKKSKGHAKGTPTAVLISVGVHVALLAVAGGLVVFTAIKTADKKFVPPPPIDRPKMDLKKPVVKVKQTSKPRTAQRIVSKSVASMPDIALPDVSGMGSGLSGGGIGYELLPDVSTISMFGGSKSSSVGNDFEGTFYVLNRSRDGTFLGYSNQDSEYERGLIAKFIENDWSPYVFAPYYRSGKKLFATHFTVPLTPSSYGPRAFGVPFDSKNPVPMWVAHYKGKISSKKGGTYRFWGASDEILLVRLRDKLVLNACLPEWVRDITPDWDPDAEQNLKYPLMANLTGYSAIGHWFTLEPGEVVEMEVLIGDMHVVHFGCYLMIEDKAESPYYPRRRLDDMPILPAFRTAEMPEAVKTKIKYEMFREEMDLEGGEVFNVY